MSKRKQTLVEVGRKTMSKKTEFTLNVGPVTMESALVAAAALCSVELDVSQVRIGGSLAEHAAQWGDQLLYRTIIDDAIRWNVEASLCHRNLPGRSWEEVLHDRIISSCPEQKPSMGQQRYVAYIPGILNQGTHTILMQAFPAGHQRRSGNCGGASAPELLEVLSHQMKWRRFRAFAAGRRRRDFRNPPPARFSAQSREQLESSRAWVPYIAGCEFSPATMLRAAALQSKQTGSLAAYGAGQLTAQRPCATTTTKPYRSREQASSTAAPQDPFITRRLGTLVRQYMPRSEAICDTTSLGEIPCTA